MAEENSPMFYNNPSNKLYSTIDGGDGKTLEKGNPQLQEFYYYKKALIEARREMYFSPLADTINMPKNSGTVIKRYMFLPILDDRNLNSQGIDAAGATIDPGSGNLYGSSKDIGYINKKLPIISEAGGRVNRVGFTRTTRVGTFENLGFFTEYSQDALNYDSMSDLMSHMSREIMNAAVQITEGMLQRDLLHSAGVRLFTGLSTDMNEVTAEGPTPSVVTYEDLMRLDQLLTDNRCPTDTTIITGTRMVDTRTIGSKRIMFVGSEVTPLLRNMTQKLGTNIENPVFIPVEKYAAATKPMNGEIGSIGPYRIIQVPDMFHWAGNATDDIGATVSDNPGFRETDGRYNVYPMLVVGSDSFNTIGFESGNNMPPKFTIMHQKPGKEVMSYHDPYGKIGRTSIQWHYGFLCNRPEWIGLIYTVAPI